MLKHAALVNNDFIICSHSLNIYDGDFQVDCNAIMMVFIKARQVESEGGILFVDGCVGLQEAAMIVAAKVARVILTREPTTSDELCAVELLKEKGIFVKYDSYLIL